MAKTYKIHPAIGFARVGNSLESFPGPTVPGVLAQPKSYRDNSANKLLKRQAVTFWVYEHEDANADGKLVKVGPNLDVIGIKWTVHLANKKALWFEFHGLRGEKDILKPPLFGYPADSLRNPDPPLDDPNGRRQRWVIDPGPRTLSAPGTAEFSKGTSDHYPETWPEAFKHGNAPGIETLGTMQFNDEFSLSIVGGFGNSGSIDKPDLPSFANNPGWFDDTSDGPVRATLILKDGSEKVVDGSSWVIVGPPDFAPPIENIVPMYDAMYDVGLRILGADPSIYNLATGTFLESYTPSFERDIYPILNRAFMYRWVHDNKKPPHGPTFHATLANFPALSTPPIGGNDPNFDVRNTIFGLLRDPNNGLTEAFDSGNMPKLHGDEGEGTALTVTVTQYEIMRRWRDGKFSRGTGSLPPAPPTTITTTGLDRAALDACVGGAFYPGIECGWIVREPDLYVKPFEFRFRHAANEDDFTGLSPGDVTKRSACPWQADFNDCGDNWWPAQRPNQVRLLANSPAYDQWARKVTTVNGATVGGHMGMVMNWSRLGVVVPGKDPVGNAVNFEDERTL